MPTQHYIASPYPCRHADGAEPQALIAASVANFAPRWRAGRGQRGRLLLRADPRLWRLIVPPKGWLKAMRDATRELGILFVVDEVITGFGRAGPMFACQAEGVEPDLITVAKGLTAGYAPMGATMMSGQVYAGIPDGSPAGASIGHGASYSAHPVSAAVALEVVRLHEEGGVLANGQRGAAHSRPGSINCRASAGGDARFAACWARWSW